MDVAAILRTKGSDVVTIRPDQTMADAVSLFAEHDVGALVISSDNRSVVPVVNKGSLHGIVSIGDIVKWRLTELENANNQLETYITGVPR